MLFKKISYLCWLIFLISIQFGYQSKEAEHTEDSTEIYEGSADITDDNSTVINEQLGVSTISDITIESSSYKSTIQSSTRRHVHRPRPSRRPTTQSTTHSLTENSEKTSTTMNSSEWISTSTKPSRSEQDERCNRGGYYDGKFDINHWPQVSIGQNSTANCPYGAGKATWKCLETGRFDPKGPDFSNCTDWLDDLDNISEIQYLGQAIHVIEFISNKTVNSSSISQSEKLSKVLDIISKVQTLVDNANDTNLHKLQIYANNIFETFTHIMDQKQAWVNSTVQEKANLASKILIGTQSSSYTLSLQQNTTNNFVEILNNDFYINTFYTHSSTELKFPVNNENFSSIIIPANTIFANSTVERNSTAIGAIIRNLNEYMSVNMEEYQEINSDILSFSLTNSSERLILNQDVTITLKHKHRLQIGDKVECVFWDFNQTKWSSEGCYQLVNQSDLLHTVCKCNHLTNFAALMDVQGREEKTLLKSLLTYFCSVLSIIGLMFTINLIIRSTHNSHNIDIKGSLNEMRSIITCNLCICLLITNILVIVGMDRTDILWLCQMSSALLLYSLLSSFSWMLMEGYYLYKSLVSVFNQEFKAFYLYGMGYGFPIAIFIVSFTIIYIKEDILFEALFDERYNYFCWISSSHYPSHIWILIGPAVCVIASNCILMFISLRTAFRILQNQSSFGKSCDKTKLKFKQIISFVFILFLLGITWLSFLFYIHQLLTTFFAHLFIVLNGSQGFFIFLYHLSIFDFKGNRRSDSTNSSTSKLA